MRTIASGISAGTELTAYRGTNPYLTSVWDPVERLFHRSEGDRPPAYPVEGWGYSEVGTVTEVADGVTEVAPGDVVWGIWGHRAEATLPVGAVRGHGLPPDVNPVTGCFARVAAIALNAVLAADVSVGSTVVVVGQGVIGLLATRFAVLAGARVLAVEGLERRRERAVAFGAQEVLAPGADLAERLRDRTGAVGADAAIELSGTHPGLAEAIRAVGADGRVVAAGFYQGEAGVLRLGEEFHHNRVQLISSQIGAVPQRLSVRWDPARMHRAAMEQVVTGRVDVLSLVTHRFPLSRAQEAYELLDTRGAEALQVVLEAA